MSKIEVQYPVSVEKPSFQQGISYMSRLDAWNKLMLYHNMSELGILAERDIYFRDFARFCRSHPPDRNTSAEGLSSFIRQSDRRLNGVEDGFLSLARILEGTIKESMRSCTYRSVEAAAFGRVSLEDEQGLVESFNIGAVANSGSHEFLSADPQIQAGILSNLIAECLAVGGVAVSRDDPEGWNDIEEIARDIIGKRTKQPFLYNPNCLAFSNLAQEGAKNYANTHNFSLKEESIQFRGCLMNRLNRGAYEEVGLEAPPMLGRLNCISACGESQALARLFEAANIPLLLPFDSKREAVYLLSAEHGAFVNNSWPIPAIVYNYYSGREDEGRFSLDLRRLMVDMNLLWHPLKEANKPPFWLSKFLANYKGILDQYPSISIYQRGDYLIITGSDLEEKKHTIVDEEGDDVKIITNSGRRKVFIVPVESVPSSPNVKTNTYNLHTTAVPCVYCTRNIIKEGVEHLYIKGKPNVTTLKGDDGLAWDWLKNVYEGEVTIVP